MSASAYLQTGAAKTHVNKASLVVDWVVVENVPDTGSGSLVFGNHVEVSSSTGSGQLIA